jgi:S-adenosylmethionine hydrolase
VVAAVVDPGVGTERKSIAVRTNSGHRIICPDNGLLSLLHDKPGISEVIVIDESATRLPGSNDFYTFHGRDIYAYNAAKIASGVAEIKDLGSISNLSIQLLPEHKAKIHNREKITGRIVKIEKPFGNIVTNISEDLLEQTGIKYGDSIKYSVFHDGRKYLEGQLPFVKTFGEVEDYEALVYIDSSGRFGFAINRGDFGEHFEISAGLSWHLEIQR